MRNFSAKESEFDERVMKIAVVADEFEGYAESHAIRIAELADALAQKFNLAARDRHSLRHAALVHDIGELVMKREYIKSSRKLRDDERIDAQRHTVIGEQEAAKRGLNRAVQLLVRWHHEWWNGAGYPDALEGEQIPLAARILRVADTFSSLTASRPYRAAVSELDARRYLTEWAGIEFDPKIVKAFFSLDIAAELKSSAADARETSESETDAENFSNAPIENEEPLFSSQF